MVRIVKKPEERRSEIVAAACHLFLSKGYDSTTMKDVMEHLQIAKGTIYYYFSSKEELLETVIMSIADEEMKPLKKLLEQSRGTALERLKQVTISSSRRHRDNHDEMLEHLHQATNARMHVRLLAQSVTMKAPLYAELIKQGCEEGVFITDSPLECAEFLLSGIQFLIDPGIYPWTQEQLKRRWQAFPGLIQSLLRAPEGSFLFLDELEFGRKHSQATNNNV